MKVPNFDQLFAEEKHRVIFHAVWGSHAFGTATATSDLDTIGVFVMESAHYLAAPTPIKQLADERNDHRFYTLKNFMELAGNANPNLLDALFIPDDCLVLTTPYWEKIRSRRRWFVSQQAIKSYSEYAIAQIKKAKGLNQKVNQPQPVEPPRPEDFCKFIPLADASQLPGRPVSLGDAGIDLTEYQVSAVEGSGDLYRLYHYGAGANGVFHHGELVCSSIPLEEENRRFSGFLLFNPDAFAHAKSMHKQYWLWRRERNEARWQAQESGGLDYNPKNMMHTFRLLYSGLNIARCGEPLVRFSGKLLDDLLAIKQGKFRYEDLLAKAQALAAELTEAPALADLPETADTARLEELLLEVTEAWEKDHER